MREKEMYNQAWRVRLEFIVPDSENDPSLWDFESLIEMIRENPNLLVQVQSDRLVPADKEGSA